MLRTWDLSVVDTYLQQTTHVADSELFVQADISPDGKQVAYRSLDDQGIGWITFADTLTGEATPSTRLPLNEGPYPLGSWHPEGGRYAAHCDVCAESGIVSVFDTATGERLHTRDVVDGAGGVLSLAYVDDGRSLLAGNTDLETLIVDAETLRPHSVPFDVMADCCATPIGDGSTALVHDHAGDNASVHWQVIDVGTGEMVSEGDVGVGVFASIASPDGSTLAVAGDAGEIVTIDLSTGVEQRRSTSLGAAVRGSRTPRTGSGWSPPPRTAGSACGTPRRWTCWVDRPELLARDSSSARCARPGFARGAPRGRRPRRSGRATRATGIRAG